MPRVTSGRGDRQRDAAEDSDLFGLLLQGDVHALGVRGLPVTFNGPLYGMGLLAVLVEVVGRDGAFAKLLVTKRNETMTTPYVLDQVVGGANTRQVWVGMDHGY